jgi:hypothetical protein
VPGAEGLTEGRALPASVRSVEDHGYVLNLGIKVRLLSSLLSGLRFFYILSSPCGL